MPIYPTRKQSNHPKRNMCASQVLSYMGSYFVHTLTCTHRLHIHEYIFIVFKKLQSMCLYKYLFLFPNQHQYWILIPSAKETFKFILYNSTMCIHTPIHIYLLNIKSICNLTKLSRYKCLKIYIYTYWKMYVLKIHIFLSKYMRWWGLLLLLLFLNYY